MQARAVFPGPTVDRRIDVIFPTHGRGHAGMAQHRRHNAIEWSKKQWDTAVEVLLFVRACAARRDFEQIARAAHVPGALQKPRNAAVR